MSRKRLLISVAAASLLAIGAPACERHQDDHDGRGAADGDDATGGGGTGEKVTIIASVPPTDHGWLGAISKDAQAAADTARRRRLRAARGR